MIALCVLVGTEAVVDCSIFIRCCFRQHVYSDSPSVLSIIVNMMMRKCYMIAVDDGES